MEPTSGGPNLLPLGGGGEKKTFSGFWPEIAPVCHVGEGMGVGLRSVHSYNHVTGRQEGQWRPLFQV